MVLCAKWFRKRWGVLCTSASTGPCLQRWIWPSGWSPGSQRDRLNQKDAGKFNLLGASEWRMGTPKIQGGWQALRIVWPGMSRGEKNNGEGFYTHSGMISLFPLSLGRLVKKCQLPHLFTSSYLERGESWLFLFYLFKNRKIGKRRCWYGND